MVERHARYTHGREGGMPGTPAVGREACTPTNGEREACTPTNGEREASPLRHREREASPLRHRKREEAGPH